MGDGILKFNDYTIINGRNVEESAKKYHVDLFVDFRIIETIKESYAKNKSLKFLE
jgi:Mor family transcriptional regulator